MMNQIIINWLMQNRDEFYPDIETKYKHLLTHMEDKNKVTDELISILQEICNLERYYSTSLDKFANSISKLLIGKDPLKDILIIFERIIASKSEQSNRLAEQIKDDLIPFLTTSVDAAAQQKLKQRNLSIKETRNTMQRKLRSLYASESQFKKVVSDMGNMPKGSSYSDRQRAQQIFRKKEDGFSDTIDSYNASIDDYMVKYSEICQELSEIETKRKYCFRDAINKLVIFEINYIKHIEYNLNRYAKNLALMDGKLLIQDRELGGTQAFYDAKEVGGVIQLAKLSNKNYIDHIAGKKKLSPQLVVQERKVSELRSAYPPGVLPADKYDSLAQELFPILDFLQKSHHHNLLIEVVNFSKDLQVVRCGLTITLLNSLLCHQVFADRQFWASYRKRLQQKVEKEDLAKVGEKQRQLRLESLFTRDITFLEAIEINSLLSEILRELMVLVSRVPNNQLGLIPTQQSSGVSRDRRNDELERIFV